MKVFLKFKVFFKSIIFLLTKTQHHDEQGICGVYLEKKNK